MHTEKRPGEETVRRQPSKSQEETSPEIKPAGTLTLDFWLPELGKNSFPQSFKPPSP